MDAFQILVIILSTFLAIFLILAIVLVVYLLKVVKSVKQISTKAEAFVDNAGNITANVAKFVTPATAGKLIMDAIGKAVKNHNKKSK